MSRPVNVADYREAARRRLPKILFDYVDGAAYAEQTLAANTADFQALKLRQRILKDVSKISLKTELFGQALNMPLLLGPIGMAGMYARRGDNSGARRDRCRWRSARRANCSRSRKSRCAGAAPDSGQN